MCDNTADYLYALYYTLRVMKGREFNDDDYIWRLGSKVIDKLGLGNIYTILSLNEPKFLYGIKIEIDYINSYNIQLFEDITNKIGITPDESEDRNEKQNNI